MNLKIKIKQVEPMHIIWIGMDFQFMIKFLPSDLHTLDII